jgi:hypothetical protein
VWHSYLSILAVSCEIGPGSKSVIIPGVSGWGVVHIIGIGDRKSQCGEVNFR